MKVTSCLIPRSTGITSIDGIKGNTFIMKVVTRISFWRVADCFALQKGSWVPWLIFELENTNKGIWVSGISSHVNLYEWSIQLKRVFLLLLLSSINVRPWETKLCSSDQGLTQALPSEESCASQLLSATEIAEQKLSMALGICLTLVVVFYPPSPIYSDTWCQSPMPSLQLDHSKFRI